MNKVKSITWMVLFASLWGLICLISPKTVLAETIRIKTGERKDKEITTRDHRLPSGQMYDLYFFAGQAGDEVIISMSSNEFDALVYLLDKDRKVLAVDDDSGEGSDSIICNFSLPEDGQYFIWATTQTKGEKGKYTLSLDLFPSPSTLTPINLDQPVAGSLSDSDTQFTSGQYLDAYTFTAYSDESILIKMNSSELDTYLWLLDSSGKVLTTGNDGSGTTDSQIIFVPKIEDTYTIWTSSYNPEEAGSYTLTVSTSALPGSFATLYSSSYLNGALDAKVDSQLNTGQFLDTYVFNGIAGQTATLDLNSSDFDSYLRLFDSNGALLKNSDDAYISMTLPATGTYIVWVSTVFANNAGDYTLSLDLSSMGTSATIIGNIADYCSEAGISGVELTTSPVGYFTTTDSQGNYTFANVSANTYSISAEHDLYQDDSIDNIIVNNEEVVTANLLLLSNDPLPTFYQDLDGDSFGNPLVTTQDCSAPADYVADNTDCNDDPSNNGAAQFPGNSEICDYLDNDCDTEIDEGVELTFYQDADSDNFGNPAVTTQDCSAPTGYVADNTDCNDDPSNNGAVQFPGNPEICDYLDNDCDTQVDEGVKTTFYHDFDGDGYGNPAVTQDACSAPVEYVTDNADCDDNDPNVNPGVTEICDNQVDDNCDSVTDEETCEVCQIIVSKDGTGDFSIIQEAIEVAATGCEIIVETGIYTENIDFLGKAITVRTIEGAVIDGNQSGSVAAFNSGENSNSVLVGFNLINGSGTDLDGDGNTYGGGIISVNSSPLITNCTLSSNMANKSGGAVYSDNSSVSIVNCTITGNEAENGGGIGAVSPAMPIVMNSILWGNTAVEDNEIFTDSGVIDITYSDIEGGHSGTGNIDQDPLFEDPVNGDYQLLPDSPCIDAASSDSPAPLTDQNDDPRYDDPATPDTGTGADGGHFDMGALEFQGIGCTDGDVDGYYDREGCGTEVDCDDGDELVYPGAEEVCDGMDNNCDGQIDEESCEAHDVKLKKIKVKKKIKNCRKTYKIKVKVKNKTNTPEVAQVILYKDGVEEHRWTDVSLKAKQKRNLRYRYDPSEDTGKTVSWTAEIIIPYDDNPSDNSYGPKKTKVRCKRRRRPKRH